MKLLFLVNARMPTEKAHGLQIMKTIEAFVEQGVEVDLLLPERKNYITQSIAEFYQLKLMPHITILKNPFSFLETRWKWLYFVLQRTVLRFQMISAALFRSYDYIYSREIGMCYLLQILKPGKVIFEDHEPKKYPLNVYRFLVRHLSKKVIVAQGLEELYSSYGVNPTTYVVAPNGFDAKEFAQVKPDRTLWRNLGIDPIKKIIVYTGHFYAWKGIYTVLSAAAMLQDYQVVLIGGTPEDRKNIEDEVMKKNLSNVTVLEFVQHRQVVQYIKSADALILPNTGQEERSQKFTTPIKLFEYMASGVPMVASDIPSFQFYLKNEQNALLFAPDNAFELTKKINLLFHNPAFGRSLSMQALENSRAYTWECRAGRILSFIGYSRSSL